MDYSQNLGLYLPSRDKDDIVDVNQISENFNILDNEIGNVEEALESKADKSELSELEITHWAHITQLQTEVGKKADKSAVENLELLKMDKVMGSEGQYAAFNGIAPQIIPTSPDTAPTENSNKLITSGAVYSAIGNIESALDSIIAIQNNLIGGDAK